jgi:hypothetical protein
LTVRNGEKGPVEIEMIRRRVQTRIERKRTGPEEWLVVTRRPLAHDRHHHMALSLMAVWFLIDETHRGQQLTPSLTLPQVRYGLSRLLLEVFYTPGVDDICRQVQRQLKRNESAQFYHHRTRKCIPPRRLRRDIQ